MSACDYGCPPTEDELACIGAALASFLDKTATVKRITRTPDGLGSATETTTTIGTVACGVTKPTSGLLTEYAEKLGALVTWQVKFPLGTDVRIGDLLEIDGATMLVQAPLKPTSWSFLDNFLASELK